MLFEIASSSIVGGIYLAAKLKQKGGGKNDYEKIVKIADACGLKKEDDSIQLLRKSPNDRFTEYVFRIPLGLSFKQFEKNFEAFQDGLNNKKREYTFDRKGLKKLWLYLKNNQFNRKSFAQDLREMFFEPNEIKKRVKMSYDGTLHFKVFDKGMETMIQFDEKFFKGCTGWKVPLGDDGEEFLAWEVGREHIAIAGGTRQGKTQFSKMFITSLLHLYPNKTKLSLIDLKGGLSFQRYANLEQTENFAYEIKGARQVLEDIADKIVQRQAELAELGVETAEEAGIYEKHFIFIDEASRLSPEVVKSDREDRKKCQECLSLIATIGAGLGYFLVFCTQYPTVDVMSKDIKSNVNQVVCFKLRSGNQSQVVLDEWGAEKLPCRGRAIVIDGVKKHIIQAPLMDDSYIEEVIAPHIVIKSRKDDDDAKNDSEGTKNGQHTFFFEETDLS
ncbi:MAG TPA: FtsK/SpoIIIE domain-containing protein [Bacillus sp. (in: firmicutes)]|nr:FtsK/SpoIIIE domain-containing protein [Bacillus sp. (in: firmicutes)]